MVLSLLLLTALAPAAARLDGGYGGRGMHDGRGNPAPKPKHFVVALVDDLGGYNVPWRNPKQRMADDLMTLSTEEGMRLENFYTFKYCSPTRSSFLSARFALHVNELNGGVCDSGGIDLRMKLLPAKLKAANFRSYMLGKGHIGARSEANLPINRGFDHHLGFLGGGEDHFTQRIQQGVDLYLDDAPAYGLNGTYSCDLYSGKAVSLIEDHAANHPTKGMFLYLTFHDVHEPYQALDRFRDPSCPDQGRQTMQAMVSCVSEGTGNVSRALRKTGMWDTTLFLWSSDNGGPQYWLGNNFPYRGGKGVDFEGGVAAAAFVTGGALPSHLYGQASSSPMHVADLHVTICRLAGLTELACQDDDIPGVPPIDGIDFRVAFERLNVTRPIAQGHGPSKGTQEIVLSSNGGNNGDNILPADGVGAYIDFNLSNGGPWKLVRNTSHVLKNDASPKGSGYWTGPIWPVNNSHVPLEADPGCPAGGCLFNLRLDRTEHKEFSAEQPAIKARMSARLQTLIGTRFQTSSSYTGGNDDCKAIEAVVAEHHGFIAPCCTIGESWSETIPCAIGGGGGGAFEVFSPANNRGKWSCGTTNSGKAAQTTLTAQDGTGGAKIGFARLNDVVQPPAGGHSLTVSVLMQLQDGDGSESPQQVEQEQEQVPVGCSYTSGGVIIGMGAKPGSASSDQRDDFSGYVVTLTAPRCTGKDARIAIQRHDAAVTHGGQPTYLPMASAPLPSGLSTGDWVELQLVANATHISAHAKNQQAVTTADGGTARPSAVVALVEVALLPGKPVGCSGVLSGDEREPWEAAAARSGGVGDACAVGLYQHRVTAAWRELALSSL